jgi:hypothetical protein
MGRKATNSGAERIAQFHSSKTGANSTDWIKPPKSKNIFAGRQQ